MKLSKTGKPLCCQCRKLATNSLEYRVTENGMRKKQYVYLCDTHATTLSEKGIQR